MFFQGRAIITYYYFITYSLIADEKSRALLGSAWTLRNDY